MDDSISPPQQVIQDPDTTNDASQPAPAAVPRWQDVSSTDKFKAATPEKQLIAFDRWQQAAKPYVATLPNYDPQAYDAGVSKRMEEFTKAAGGLTPDAARIKLATDAVGAVSKAATDTRNAKMLLESPGHLEQFSDFSTPALGPVELEKSQVRDALAPLGPDVAKAYLNDKVKDVNHPGFWKLLLADRVQAANDTVKAVALNLGTANTGEQRVNELNNIITSLQEEAKTETPGQVPKGVALASEKLPFFIKERDDILAGKHPAYSPANDETARLQQERKKDLVSFFDKNIEFTNAGLGVTPEEKNSVAGQLAGAVGSVSDLAFGGKGMLVKMATDSFSKSYDASVQEQKAKGETDTAKIEDTARRAAMQETALMVPQLLAFHGAGAVAGLGGKLLPEEASTLTRGLVGAGTSALANMGVSGATRLASGQSFFGDIGQTATDTLFGAIGGVHAGLANEDRLQALADAAKIRASLAEGENKTNLDTAAQVIQQTANEVVPQIKDLQQTGSPETAKATADIAAEEATALAATPETASATAAKAEEPAIKLTATLDENGALQHTLDVPEKSTTAELQAFRPTIENSGLPEANKTEALKELDSEIAKRAAVDNAEFAAEPYVAPKGEAGQNTPADVREGLKGFAKGISQSFFDSAFKALEEGKTKIAGIEDPILKKAKPFFDAGLIKSAEEFHTLYQDGTIEKGLKAEAPTTQYPNTLQPVLDKYGLTFDGEHNGKLNFTNQKGNGETRGHTFTVSPDITPEDLQARIDEKIKADQPTPEQQAVLDRIAARKAAAAPAPEPVLSEKDTSISDKGKLTVDTQLGVPEGVKVSEKPAPVPLSKLPTVNEGGVIKPAWTNDPLTVAHQIDAGAIDTDSKGKGNRLYIPEAVMEADPPVLDPSIEFATEKQPDGSYKDYVTGVNHEKYGLITEKGQYTDRYEADKEVQARREAQTKGKEFQLTQERDAFDEKLNALPAHEKEGELVAKFIEKTLDPYLKSRGKGEGALNTTLTDRIHDAAIKEATFRLRKDGEIKSPKSIINSIEKTLTANIENQQSFERLVEAGDPIAKQLESSPYEQISDIHFGPFEEAHQEGAVATQGKSVVNTETAKKNLAEAIRLGLLAGHVHRGVTLGGKPTDGKYVLTKLTNSTSEGIRIIAKALLDSKVDLKKLKFKLYSDPHDNTGAAYAPNLENVSEGTVYLNLAIDQPMSVEASLLHEIGHHFDLAKLDESYARNPVEQAAFEGIKDAYKKVSSMIFESENGHAPKDDAELSAFQKENLEKGGLNYWIGSIHEFSQSVKTEPRVMGILAAMDEIKGAPKTSKFQGYLSNIVAWLNELFVGKKVTTGSPFEKVLSDVLTLATETPISHELSTAEAPTQVSNKTADLRFKAEQKVAQLRGSSERPLRGLDEAISYASDGDVTKGFGLRLTEERMELANNWLVKNGQELATTPLEAKDRITQTITKAEDSFATNFSSIPSKVEIKGKATQQPRIVTTVGQGSKVEGLEKATPSQKDALLRQIEASTHISAEDKAKLIAEIGEIPRTAGVAQRVREAHGTAVEPGIGTTPQEAIARGRELKASGVNPETRLAEVEKANYAANADDMSLFRAHDADLRAAYFKALDAKDPVAAKAALDAHLDWAKKIKPVQTEWSKVGAAQQGETEIDTGSYHGLQYDFVTRTGRDFTPKEAETAKDIVATSQKTETEIAAKSEELTKAVQAESEKLPSEATAAGEGGSETSKGGGVATGKPKAKKTSLPTDVEGLSKHFAEKYKDHTGIDANFTQPEINAIWKFTKENYLDGNHPIELGALVNSIGSDLGLKSVWVREALAANKTVRKISDDLYRLQTQRTAVLRAARTWVADSTRDPLLRKLETVWNFRRALSVLGHVNAPLTHAGSSLFVPNEFAHMLASTKKGFQYFRDPVFHRAQMESIIADKNYREFSQAGLGIKPGLVEDVAEYQHLFGKLGEAGDRGMDVLKTMRLERMKQRVAQLSPELRADPEVIREMAQLVNVETGLVNKGILGEALGTRLARNTLFAARLEGSRWQNIFVNSTRAARIYTRWNSATNAEKVFAKHVMKRNITLASVYMSALAANQAVLSASHSEDKINITDPTKSDWLAFKWNGHVVGAPSSFLSPLRFTLGVMASPFIKGSNNSSVGGKFGDYAAGKMNPTISDIAELIHGKQLFTNRPLPWMQPSKLRSGKEPLSYIEYALSKSPIPFAQVTQEVSNTLQDNPELHLWSRKTVAHAAVAFASSVFAIHTHPAHPESKKKTSAQR